MKIGISMYSYSRSLREGKMKMTEAISAAKAAGYVQLEFTNLEPPDGGDVIEYAKYLRKFCEGEGIPAVAYMVNADFVNGCDGNPAKEAERLKHELDVAKALGVKMMRHDAAWNTKGRRDDYKTVVKEIAPHIRAVAEYASILGVKTMTENHGYFLQESCRMEYLIEKVAHENYGLCIDMGNFICADESPVVAVSRLAPYAFHLHAKDFLYKDGSLPFPGEGWFPTRGCNHLRGTIVGHGAVPVQQCLKIMLKSGYEGDLALEFEGLEDPCDAAVKGYAYLSCALNEING